MENAARAVSVDAGVSSKHTIEICAKLRNKTVTHAIKFLEGVKNKTQPVKFTRFTEGAGHKKRSGPAKYPVKAADAILKIIQSAEANAVNKGLGSDLKILHLSAQRGASQMHYGRQRRRKMKRTHLEVVVGEAKKSKSTQKKTSKPQDKGQKQLADKKSEKTSENKDNQSKSEEIKEKKKEQKQEAEDKTGKTKKSKKEEKDNNNKDSKSNKDKKTEDKK